MVGRSSRVYKVTKCFNYKQGLRFPYPVLKLKLFNVALEELGILEIPIDTGFEGSILLPTDTYRFFKIAELPRSMWRTYLTLTGIITMRVARAIAETNGIRIETYVETPLYGGKKLLLGREFLNKLTIVLDGPKNESCIVE